MNYEKLRSYCLSRKYAQESLPFDEHTLAFTVGGKIFALTGLDEPEVKVNLKCEPDYAIELREQFDFILPGYHMNKNHWNTVFAQKIPADLLKQLIDHSYDLVYQGLPRKLRNELELIQKMD